MLYTIFCSSYAIKGHICCKPDHSAMTTSWRLRNDCVYSDSNCKLRKRTTIQQIHPEKTSYWVTVTNQEITCRSLVLYFSSSSLWNRWSVSKRLTASWQKSKSPSTPVTFTSKLHKLQTDAVANKPKSRLYTRQPVTGNLPTQTCEYDDIYVDFKAPSSL